MRSWWERNKLLFLPEFAAAIENLMDCPDESTAMGERAKQRVHEHFSLDAMVEGYKALYERFWCQVMKS